MKHEASGELYFADEYDRDTVAAYLISKKNSALTEKGDFLNIGVAIDGTPSVSFLYRLGDVVERDDIYDYLVDDAPRALESRGKIEKHECGHDDGKACKDVEAVVWEMGKVSILGK